MIFSEDSSIGQVYEHPAGRDILDKILLQTGAPSWSITNPIVRNLRLGSLKYLSGGRVDRGFLTTLTELLNEQPQYVAPVAGGPTPSWWKQGVVYQIYPRSFQDSNGDGIGDLPGIIDRLDYLEGLGIDAIWMSPIFDSPNDDMGYDIRDYRKIMSEFGTMEDFDTLVTEAHKRGLKVILDLVVNHTSDEHEWFQEALSSPTSPYRDYYFFREGNETETPPNNWDSFFSGSAWNHYPEQDLWALHLFSKKQMDLNWDNASVRKEVSEIVKFWVDRGVDGFRLDVINYISKREGLPDGNELIGKLMGFRGVEHYFYGPELHRYLSELHRRAFAPNHTFTVGETPGIGAQVEKQITDPAAPELDLIFNFNHLETTGHVRMDDYLYDLNFLKNYYAEVLSETVGQYWVALFFENHDNPRMISKVNPDPAFREVLGKLLGGILLTLRGTPFLYQGQELGMVNQKFESIEDLRDVEAINQFTEMTQTVSENDAFRYLLAGTRDHARTPVQWSSEPYGGFSTSDPWIRGDQDYLRMNAADEEHDPDSILNFYRQLLHWRQDHEDFIYADIEFLDLPTTNYWAYKRGNHVIQMNLSAEKLELGDELVSQQMIQGAVQIQSNLPGKPADSPDPHLEPYEWRLWEIR